MNDLPTHVTAAMARLRDLTYTDLLTRYPREQTKGKAKPGDPGPMGFAVDKWFADCRVLVGEFLKRHDENDNEVLTPGWMLSVGFERLDEDNANFFGLVSETGELLLSTECTEAPFSFAVANYDWPWDVYSRGQLRGLAAQCGQQLPTTSKDAQTNGTAKTTA